MAEHEAGRIPLREIGSDVREQHEDAAVPLADDHPPGVVAPGRRVTLHFALALEDGSRIDSNFDGKPVSCVIGDGNLLPGFEQVLVGMTGGDRNSFLLEPEQAFGAVNPDNVQKFQRYQFPPDLPLATGLVVDFNDAAGNSQAGVIKAIEGKLVEVDFNHPLAGRRICFDVEIIAVAAAGEG